MGQEYDTQVPAVDPAIRAEVGARSTRLALGLPEPAVDRYAGLTDQQRYEAYERDRDWQGYERRESARMAAKRLESVPDVPETDAYQDAAIDAHFETLTPEQAEAERERIILAGSADPLVGRGPDEDAPRYAWTAEGEITSGTLDRYRLDYEMAEYGGMSIGTEVWNGERTYPVWVWQIGTDSNDYMHYAICVRENGETGRIIDWTYMTIDGRA